MENEKTPEPKKSYGKRSLRQWIVIYLIVAIIVYALIYFIWIHKSGSSGSGLGY